MLHRLCPRYRRAIAPWIGGNTGRATSYSLGLPQEYNLVGPEGVQTLRFSGDELPTVMLAPVELSSRTAADQA